MPTYKLKITKVSKEQKNPNKLKTLQQNKQQHPHIHTFISILTHLTSLHQLSQKTLTSQVRMLLLEQYHDVFCEVTGLAIILYFVFLPVFW